MKTSSVIKLYDNLVPKIGRDATDTLASFIQENITMEMENHVKQLVTKKDLEIQGREIKQEISVLRTDLEVQSREIRKEILVLRTDLEARGREISVLPIDLETQGKLIRHEMSELFKDFRIYIEKKFSSMYKLIFVCWLTQILAILGFLKYFLK